MLTHDNLLFATSMGWHCLMQLGELVDPDAIDLCDYQKTHQSVSYSSSHPHMSLTLLRHKADCFYEGSTVMLEASLTHY